MYSLFEETVQSAELGDYVTYGVRSESGAMVQDVSLDYAEIHAFVLELNQSDVDEAHFYDVIEDFVAR